MIKVKVHDLLWNNRTNIQKVHEATGLSRTTLSNLMNGNAKGIQFETLNSLAHHFNCDIADIIEYREDDTE